MGKRAGLVFRRISATRCNRKSSRGFTLIEMVCALAIISIALAVALPSLPRATSRARVEAYAVQVASLLQLDRHAAVGQSKIIVTSVDAQDRRIRSGASDRAITLPPDLQVHALLSHTCRGRFAGAGIWFFPSGQSCGGVIELSKPDLALQIRVNWLTGGVDIVSGAS